SPSERDIPQGHAACARARTSPPALDRSELHIWGRFDSLLRSSRTRERAIPPESRLKRAPRSESRFRYECVLCRDASILTEQPLSPLALWRVRQNHWREAWPQLQCARLQTCALHRLGAAYRVGLGPSGRAL